jgi:RNA ligase
MGLELNEGALTLEDIAPREQFEVAVADGWVNRTRHPSAPYEIWNYSKQTQFDRHWDEITRVCRGLITDVRTGEIVARPFPKFFNAGEDDIEIPLQEPVVVTEKVDGSLGILYDLPDGRRAVATRGSFTSQQAIHATAIMHQRYGDFDPNPAYTYLFEIIYPENRVVIDYGDFDDLVLLGAVDKTTGRSVSLEEAGERWSGPIVQVYPYRSFTEVNRDGIAENREGFVVHFLDSDLRLKVKSDWYFRMHKLFTQTSAKTIWENLMAGLDVEGLFSEVPSDLQRWVIATATSLREGYASKAEEIEREYREVIDQLGSDFARKDFALAIAMSPNRPYLFAKLDGKPLGDMIWRGLKPEYEKPFLESSE